MARRKNGAVSAARGRALYPDGIPIRWEGRPRVTVEIELDSELYEAVKRCCGRAGPTANVEETISTALRAVVGHNKEAPVSGSALHLACEITHARQVSFEEALFGEKAQARHRRKLVALLLERDPWEYWAKYEGEGLPFEEQDALARDTAKWLAAEFDLLDATEAARNLGGPRKQDVDLILRWLAIEFAERRTVKGL